MKNQLEKAESTSNEDFKFLSKKDLKSLTLLEFKKHESKVQDKYNELGQISANPETFKPLKVKDQKILERLHKYVTNFAIEPQNIVQKVQPEKVDLKNNTVPVVPFNKEKNIDYLTNQIKFLGFGESPEVLKALKSNIDDGKEKFNININYDKASNKNEASFELKFNRSEKTGSYFLNSFLANLKKENQNEILSHTFAVKQNGLTAKQAVNLLEGRSVLVVNNSKEVPENLFMNLKLNDEKLPTGNFKAQHFNTNLGINTSKIVENSPIKFDTDLHKDITIKSLNRGNIVNVKFDENGIEKKGFAILNPQNKSIKLFDQDMNRTNDNKPAVNESLNLESSNKNTMKQSR